MLTKVIEQAKIDHFTKWFLIIGKEGATLVIFKTIIGFIEFFVMNLDVTDVAVIFLIKGIVAHNTDTINADTVGLDVILSEKLETTTNR